MQIIAQCPKCGTRWRLNANSADKRINCRKCHMLFKVPKLSELAVATKILKNAKGIIYVDQKGKTYG